MSIQSILDGGRIAAGGIKDFAGGLIRPTLRIGVTGLSQSGKTVFITALVNALLKGARMPAFEAYARGRIVRCYLEPQPDDDVPRFPFEENIKSLIESRTWPEGTKHICQLRITIEYEPLGFLARNIHGGKLHVDIVDYPGEWLLDLPLMQLTYQQWSTHTLAAARQQPRVALSKDYLQYLDTLSPMAPADELVAVEAARRFTAYLSRCRASDVSLSSLPPGRFLLPGDLKGSPLLTFAPLPVSSGSQPEAGSLAALMARRYDSYVAKVVRPFFLGHFARLNRQIVLVDALAALNAGPSAVTDLQQTLADVLRTFRVGTNSPLTEILGRRVDRVLFAATKADLLNHQDHDKLEAILRKLVADAAERCQHAGAAINITALAAIRATREARVTHKGETLACIAGTPEKGEIIADTRFDGLEEAAVFPGDLPADPNAALDGSLAGQLRFVRFRPPLLTDGAFPHIRLDRALEYLLGESFS